MKRTSLSLFPVWITALLLITAGRAYAHHSFAASYLMDQEVTVTGTVTQFVYRNPHSFLKIKARNDRGKMITWMLEWGGAAQLYRDHVTPNTLKPGDEIAVTGNPGRDSADADSSAGLERDIHSLGQAGQPILVWGGESGTHRIRVHKIVRKSDGWTWEGVIM